MIQLAQADAVRLPLGDGVVSLCCTSPPYFSLRDYGIAGQMGLEKTPDEYIAKLVEVFREVRRVLAPDGLVFCNLGDSYAANRSYQVPDGKHMDVGNNHGSRVPPDLKPKDLCLIPQRAAIALQRDGWWVRSFMPWTKNNCLPESVRDRPTTSHEYWIMLAKSKRYFWDADSVRVGHKSESIKRMRQPITTARDRFDGGKLGASNFSDYTDRKTGWGNPSGRNRRTSDTWLDGLDTMIEEQRRYLAHLEEIRDGTGMLAGRDGEPLGVRFNTASYKGAHFATFGAKMIVPFIKAGSSERGVCPVCRAAWVRVVDSKPSQSMQSGNNWQGGRAIVGHHGPSRPGSFAGASSTTTGWRPSCACGAPEGMRPDDFEIVSSPAGQRGQCNDPTMETGRGGYNRPRGDDEGQRPITRYEQRHHAEQLRNSPGRPQMEAQAGSAFDHYIRTDKSGARPVPARLLEDWINSGWLERVAVPEWQPPEPIPALVLDPFVGSGTTLEVARALGRDAVGFDLSFPYLRDQARERLSLTALDAWENGKPGGEVTVDDLLGGGK